MAGSTICVTVQGMVGDILYGPVDVDRSMTILEIKEAVASEVDFVVGALVDAETFEPFDEDASLEESLALEIILTALPVVEAPVDADEPEFKPKLMEWEINALERKIIDGDQKFGANEDYQISTLIGSGGQAKVYQCCQIQKGQQFAVKVFRLSRLTNVDQVNLKREVDALKNLSHPRIVNIHEDCSTEYHFFLIMDLACGCLLEYVQNEGKLNEDQSRYVFWQLLDGVSYMHTQEILHRDLKLENLLLDNFDLMTIKITDFGFAKKVPLSHGASVPVIDPLERARTDVGTEVYKAPEVLFIQFRQGPAGSYDKEIDYWGIGVCLYMMMCGKKPFGSGSNEELIRVGKFARGIDWDRLSDVVKDVIEGLLHVDTGMRFGLQQCLRHDFITDGGNPVNFPMPLEPPWRAAAGDQGGGLSVSPGVAALWAHTRIMSKLRKRTALLTSWWKRLKSQLPHAYQGVLRVRELSKLVVSLSELLHKLCPEYLEVFTRKRGVEAKKKVADLVAKTAQASAYMIDKFLPDLCSYEHASSARKALEDPFIQSVPKFMNEIIVELIGDLNAVIVDLNRSVGSALPKCVRSYSSSTGEGKRVIGEDEFDTSSSPQLVALDHMFLIPNLLSSRENPDPQADGCEHLPRSVTESVSGATPGGRALLRAHAIATRVVDILRGCETFWNTVGNNIACTLDSDFEFIDKAFGEITSENSNARKLFEKRHEDSKLLWSCLRRMCTSVPGIPVSTVEQESQQQSGIARNIAVPHSVSRRW